MNRNFRREDDQYERIPVVIAPDKDIRSIVVEGNVELLVHWADKIGENLKTQNLSTSQIRNVYGTARQIQLRWDNDPDQSYREAILLIPKLGYYAKREKEKKSSRSEGMETLQKNLEPALRMMIEKNLDLKERQNLYNHIMEYFEAIVAYHKSHGGKSS
jgi:CRISPR-associated protein Csm2